MLDQRRDHYYDEPMLDTTVKHCEFCGIEYQGEYPSCFCEEERYDRYILYWRNKQEEKFWAIFEERQMLYQEYQAYCFTEEEYMAKVAELDAKVNAMNLHLVANGFDPIE